MGMMLQARAISMTGIISFNVALAGQPGWLRLMDGQSIGSAASGATARAHADTRALYRVLWAQYDNTALPIQTSAGAPSVRGASADADFNANKRLPLHDPDSDFLRILGGAGAADAGRVIGTRQAGQSNNVRNIVTGLVSDSTTDTGDLPEDGTYATAWTLTGDEGANPNFHIKARLWGRESRGPNTAFPVFIHL